MKSLYTGLLTTLAVSIGFSISPLQAEQLHVWPAYRGGEKSAFAKVVKM